MKTINGIASLKVKLVYGRFKQRNYHLDVIQPGLGGLVGEINGKKEKVINWL